MPFRSNPHKDFLHRQTIGDNHFSSVLNNICAIGHTSAMVGLYQHSAIHRKSSVFKYEASVWLKYPLFSQYESSVFKYETFGDYNFHTAIQYQSSVFKYGTFVKLSNAKFKQYKTSVFKYQSSAELNVEKISQYGFSVFKNR